MKIFTIKYLITKLDMSSLCSALPVRVWLLSSENFFGIRCLEFIQGFCSRYMEKFLTRNFKRASFFPAQKYSFGFLVVASFLMLAYILSVSQSITENERPKPTFKFSQPIPFEHICSQSNASNQRSQNFITRFKSKLNHFEDFRQTFQKF